eukprot:CAMPEP_0183702966 /NCGR_PEP_ID=MMETSP0737-20130205/891_1 /TAXON_ID=385413 /ORGANISM="Thalassiosira miniscula, Strain CCMP1093" /LENGTH=310 /DNA_ID=CAMNT_0025929657 /DNA_START=125 /DNA_END=1057 /DNA_ORIENTATION=-
MTATTTKKIKKTAIKRADRGVPFDEMRRLMKVYGSLKCLRKRQAAGGAENAKIDSVKRKFYRWFPDLEERFEKDKDGCYRPKLGHEAELLYREEMRAKDGKTTASKRVTCRKQRHGRTKQAKVVRSKNDNDHKHGNDEQKIISSQSADTTSTSTSTSTNTSKKSIDSSSTSSDQESMYGEEMEINLEFNHEHDLIASTSIAADVEPLDRTFIAEEGIFDDVEKSFYGSIMQSCPSLQRSSCSSSSEEDQGSICSWASDSPSDKKYSNKDSIDDSIDDIITKSMEECCEEILGSDENDDSISFDLFDMVSS